MSETRTSALCTSEISLKNKKKTFCKQRNLDWDVIPWELVQHRRFALSHLAIFSKLV